MATRNQTKYNNVEEVQHEGQDLRNVKMFGDLSENAEISWIPNSFKAFGKIMRTTNRRMATIIREYYSQTFHDLKGINITYNPNNGTFFVEFFFSKNSTPCPDNKIENLRDLTMASDGRRDFFTQKQIIDNKSYGKKYTLNDQTKVLLADIMFGGKEVNKPGSKVWNQPGVIQEIIVPITDGGGYIYGGFQPRTVEILIKVSGVFDFKRILSKLFGRSMVVESIPTLDENGKYKMTNRTAKALYEARYVKPVPYDPYVFIMNIEQFDEDHVREIGIKENPIRPMAGGIIYY